MNAKEYLAGAKVNIEVILWVNDKGVLHEAVRIRPWKQDGRVPVMILELGDSIEHALTVAARNLYKEQWEKLDWQARPWKSRPEYLNEADIMVQLDFLEAVEDVEGTKEPLPMLTRKMGKSST